MNLKEIDFKKFLDKKYYKIYLPILFGVVALITVVVIAVSIANNNKTQPEETTPEEQAVVTTTQQPGDNTQTTTPKETTPATPTETVTFPSDEDTDPKQEDVFFD